jgi:hypothetical protein
MDPRLRAIADDVWHVDGGDLRQPAGVYMPVRSTIVRLRDRSLVVYSPVAIDDALAAAIAAEGEVAHVVAPNRLHHVFAAAAVARWPRAIVHAAPGLAAKRPDLRVDRALGRDAEPAWRDELDVEPIGGAPKLDEHVLFHRASGTLVCADLVFHVTRPANLRTRLVLAMMGAGGGRLAQSRAWRFLRRDKAAARASLDRVLAWPIAWVAPCHGEPIDVDAGAFAPILRRAYAGTPRALLTATRSAGPSSRSR